MCFIDESNLLTTMTLIIIGLWFINVCCDTVGQIAFKYAAISPSNQTKLGYWLGLLRNYWLWIGFLSYGVGFLFWIAFLTLLPLSQAILLGSANIISVMIVGRLLFKEQLTPLRIIGVILITAGVILVGVG
ncbi:multidrug transporter EmrE-like cation transporter [Orbus hercynius]|uniref:Multidrug transporter EmrE-like cation transporter n=1 Tax=Orbus hercynius TaxID=593135 RepID=A0A495RHU0_9GAMM|nr:EamA family transporter [Orbus hercynius]RKS86870.1 multidrug transporter EmrE-like cation transporter [Orbus hercynius]